MNSKFGTDLTVGSVPKHLLSFSIPMLVGNLLQVSYNIINAFWVGKIVGSDAIGATAVSFPIIFILAGISNGATLSTTILVAQYFGAKNHNMVKKVVANSFSIALILGSILSLFGVLFSDTILKLMDTPSEIFTITSMYLKISLGGFLLTYFNVLILSILRGIGDTKTPLMFLAISVIINAIIDPLLIKGVGPLPNLGLNGAAIASLISQAIGLIISIIYLNRKDNMISIHIKKFVIDPKLTMLIFKIGFPSIIQQCLVSIGAAFTTTFVNKYGVSATNAFGAITRVDNVAFMPSISLGMAVSSLTGQNLGAQKPERIKEIFKWGIIMTSAITLTISFLVLLFPHQILSVFGLKPTEIAIGTKYIYIVSSCYIFFAILFISNGVINGAGRTLVTMFFSLCAVWLIRLPLIIILSNTFLGITGIWISMTVGFFTVMSISLIYYYSGRWKTDLLKSAPLSNTKVKLES